jgi:hypothetical protein
MNKISHFDIVNKEFEFVEREYGFEKVTSDNQNMFFQVIFKKGDKLIEIDFERRDNQLEFSTSNIINLEKGYFGRFNNKIDYKEDIEKMNDKLRTILTRFMKS